MVDSTSLSLRAKMLGALIKDARLTAGKNIEDCSVAMGISESTFELYEQGHSSPSLPELELLAYYLKVPLEHFWGKKTLAETDNSEQKLDVDRLVSLRNRMIGAQLRMARIQSGISLEELAQQANQTVNQIESYELGQVPIPIPVLDVLNDLLGVPAKEYYDRKGPVGQWLTQQRMLNEFIGMPPELQAFVTKPVNQPYLELAVRLSGVSVEKLRTVAEVLLEITL